MRLPLRGESGGAMVEFALVLPLLMALLLGILEFGRAWHVHHVVTDAVREGARRAAVNDGAVKVGTAAAPGTVPSVILDRLGRAGVPTAGSWDPTNHAGSCEGWSPPITDAAVATVYGCGWTAAPGLEARVAVRVPYSFGLLDPVLKLLGGGRAPIQIQSDFGMRNE